MKHLLIAAAQATAIAAAFAFGGAAQATTLSFDTPGLVTIDDDTGIATYNEAGFTISGQAAGFLTLDARLVGGFDATTPFSLKAQGGGPFSLLGLEHAFFDLGFGSGPGTLTLTALRDGIELASLLLNLGDPVRFDFSPAWGPVTEVRFLGSSGFALDNLGVLAVPEPGTLALAGVGLATVLFARRRRTPPPPRQD